MENKLNLLSQGLGELVRVVGLLSKRFEIIEREIEVLNKENKEMERYIEKVRCNIENNKY